jgi:uncharacterized iron-regulated protein
MRMLLTVAILVGLAAVRADGASDPLHNLALGDPARQAREVPVAIDTVIDSATGQPVAPHDLPSRLRTTRLLLVGEAHTSAEAHRVQLHVLQVLHRSGRPLAIGLEMFPYTEQAVLDAWVAGSLDEEAFLARSRWYEHWGYHWGYYRDIFRFAREARIPLHAVNTPREVITAVRKKGFTDLTPEEAAHMPPRVDVDSADHMAFFKAALSQGDSPHPAMADEAWGSMLAAQATWDASMAWNAVQALERAGPNALMVVLAGSGHVAYGLGIERQARTFYDGEVASIIPVPVTDHHGTRHDVARASYASFTWGVAGEREPAYPSLGISTVPAADGRSIIDVQRDSVAERAGIAVGDVMLALAGQPITGREVFNRTMAAHHWGDVVQVELRRAGERRTIDVPLRRRD